MPQPDVCLVLPRPDFYQNAHPEARDVLLAVEVADTSLDRDRGRKLPAYAAAGIPEAWLVNLPGDVVEVYREPREGRYTDARTAGRGETIAPLAFPDLALRVDEILG
jgi:Uma2 family endonuclease